MKTVGTNDVGGHITQQRMGAQKGFITRQQTINDLPKSRCRDGDDVDVRLV